MWQLMLLALKNRFLGRIDLQTYYYIDQQDVLRMVNLQYKQYLQPYIFKQNNYCSYVAREKNFLPAPEMMQFKISSDDQLCFQLHLSSQSASKTLWFSMCKTGNLNHILLNFKYFNRTFDERETFFDKGTYTGFSGLMYAILNS